MKNILIIFTVLLLLGCSNTPDSSDEPVRKLATIVTNHNTKPIVIENLHLSGGIRIQKLYIDSSEYIVYLNGRGTAIVKHN